MFLYVFTCLLLALFIALIVYGLLLCLNTLIIVFWMVVSAIALICHCCCSIRTYPALDCILINTYRNPSYVFVDGRCTFLKKELPRGIHLPRQCMLLVHCHWLSIWSRITPYRSGMLMIQMLEVYCHRLDAGGILWINGGHCMDIFLIEPRLFS